MKLWLGFKLYTLADLWRFSPIAYGLEQVAELLVERARRDYEQFS